MYPNNLKMRVGDEMCETPGAKLSYVTGRAGALATTPATSKMMGIAVFEITMVEQLKRDNA